MKILFLTSDLNKIGGLQKYSRDFLAALIGTHEVFVVEMKRSNLWNKIIFSIAACWNALVKKPDIIVCTHINFSPLCFFLKKIFGTEYIVLTHGIDVWNMKSVARKKSLMGARKIFTVSLFTKRKIIEQIPSAENKIVLLNNSVDGEKFFIREKPEHLAQKLGIAGGKVILTVSRLSADEEYRGYDKIIEVLPAVLKKVPEARYVLVGDGNDMARVRALVRARGLERQVIMPGYVTHEELMDYYNLCDVFVMLSKSEGFGIVFLEALACGKPVIAGDEDASREAILNGELGILVSPDSNKEITEAIIAVLEKNVDKKFLEGEYLRQTILKNYSIETFKKEVNALMGRL